MLRRASITFAQPENDFALLAAQQDDPWKGAPMLPMRLRPLSTVSSHREDDDDQHDRWDEISSVRTSLATEVEEESPLRGAPAGAGAGGRRHRVPLPLLIVADCALTVGVNFYNSHLLNGRLKGPS